ncbi:MAG: ImmA/IrrE family metallo-endopeptidase [Rhodomicrobium sp.]
MTDHGRRPHRWANDLNKILAAAFRDDHFPVPVENIICEYSRLKFPASPVVAVEGRPLGTFEGALYPVHDGKAWAVIFNSAVSAGRRRFTIAHEFAHYLMHRTLLPEGIECGEDAVTFRNGNDLELEADTFAASLLMPLDDFRAQLHADDVPEMNDLCVLADRYGVSLISCVVRWLEYTNRRSMIVVSRDGFVLWAKASEPAFKSGRFIRTKGVPPVEVPAASLVDRRDIAEILRDGIDHPAGIWFDERCRQLSIFSDRYDQVISILHFDNNSARSNHFEEPPEEDTFDRFSPRVGNRFE